MEMPDTKDYLNQQLDGINYVIDIMNITLPFLNEKEEVLNKDAMEEKVQNEEDTEELVQALQVLGYRRYEINKILSKVKATTLEDKIKEALQYLAK